MLEDRAARSAESDDGVRILLGSVRLRVRNAAIVRVLVEREAMSVAWYRQALESELRRAATEVEVQGERLHREWEAARLRGGPAAGPHDYRRRDRALLRRRIRSLDDVRSALVSIADDPGRMEHMAAEASRDCEEDLREAVVQRVAGRALAPVLVAEERRRAIDGLRADLAASLQRTGDEGRPRSHDDEPPAAAGGQEEDA